MRLLNKQSNLNSEKKLKSETIQSSLWGIIQTAGKRACIDRVAILAINIMFLASALFSPTYDFPLVSPFNAKKKKKKANCFSN